MHHVSLNYWLNLLPNLLTTQSNLQLGIGWHQAILMDEVHPPLGYKWKQPSIIMVSVICKWNNYCCGGDTWLLISIALFFWLVLAIFLMHNCKKHFATIAIYFQLQFELNSWQCNNKKGVTYFLMSIWKSKTITLVQRWLRWNLCSMVMICVK
jgi:hypothetical protein